MLQAVHWPHHHGSPVLEGWEFDDDVDLAEVVKATSPVGEPAGVVRGTHRWIEWILGRDAAVRAARKVGVEQPIIEVTSNGAPFVPGSDVGLSIAHTRGLALAAAAPGRIGIDVERSTRDVSRLARGLHPGEVDIAMSISVIGCLVAKEAAAKATGLGLGGSLARWPVLDAELSGSAPTVSIAAPDGRVVTTQLFSWGDHTVGVSLIPEE